MFRGKVEDYLEFELELEYIHTPVNILCIEKTRLAIKQNNHC